MKYNEDILSYVKDIYVYKDDIHNILMSVIHDKDIVDDLVQDVMLNAWKYRGTLKDTAKTKAWLNTITRNKLRQYFRRKQRLNVTESGAYMVSENDWIDSDAMDYLDIMIYNEFIFKLASVMNELSPELRQILYQHAYLNISLSEIAKSENISYNDAHVRYTRAMRILRKKLALYK